MAARKKSRKKIEREEARLRQERLAYIGTLASGLAHEIRTPLGAIQMNADLLAEDLASVPAEHREEFAKRLGRIRREGARLRKTVDSFLAFARPPRLERSPVDLNGYLDELVELVEPEAEKRRITIRKELEPRLYPVYVDTHQLAQVVMNLVTNAREAVGEQGLITIRTRQTDDRVEIEVEDNGGGVEPEDEARIFDVFFSTKEQGTGLGLGIARRIVEEHGGEITLDNRPGKGARFTVSLPKTKILEYERTSPAKAKLSKRAPAEARKDA
ncbi:MAG: sensor histidine kinase [Planctomycetota bacterium]